jgi:hypothetical protein
MQHHRHAQIWIKLMESPQEYWHALTLFDIASVVGSPLIIDVETHNRVFGHYARVLVDMDLSKSIFDEILVKRE